MRIKTEFYVTLGNNLGRIPTELKIFDKANETTNYKLVTNYSGVVPFPDDPDTVPFVVIKPTERRGVMQDKWHITIEEYINYISILDFFRDFSPGGAVIHEIIYKEKKLIINLESGTTDWEFMIVKPGAKGQKNSNDDYGIKQTSNVTIGDDWAK